MLAVVWAKGPIVTSEIEELMKEAGVRRYRTITHECLAYLELRGILECDGGAWSLARDVRGAATRAEQLAKEAKSEQYKEAA